MKKKEKVLYLSLMRDWFMIMLAGLKPWEIRAKSDRNTSLLFDKEGEKKDFTHIHFTNGYGNQLPYFKAYFNHFKDIEKIAEFPEINKTVSLGAPAYLIAFGKVIEYGNIRNLCTKFPPQSIIGSCIRTNQVICLDSLDWFQKPLFTRYLSSLSNDEPIDIHKMNDENYCVDYRLYESWLERTEGTIIVCQ